MLAVAYFAALLARSADRWSARDADLDEIEDVAGLVEFMREAPQDEEEDEPDTTVLFLEQEDVWFAVVRLDAEEDPRLFVSDVAAVSRSAYADLLLSGDLAPVGPDGRPTAAPSTTAVAPSLTTTTIITDSAAGSDSAAAPPTRASSAHIGTDTVAAVPIDPLNDDADPDVDIDLDPDLNSDLDPDADTDVDTDIDIDADDESTALATRPALATLADIDPDERRPLHAGPAGDADLLSDFGVRATKLVGLCRGGLPPSDALADLAEALGAADELEEVR